LQSASNSSGNERNIKLIKADINGKRLTLFFGNNPKQIDFIFNFVLCQFKADKFVENYKVFVAEDSLI